MHVTERENAIIEILERRGFIAFGELEKLIQSSPATIRRDLERMASKGRLERVRGGARVIRQKGTSGSPQELHGTPFHENIARNRAQKEAIGRAAAELCQPGEGIMIDGGSTTLQMCDHLNGLNLQVLTNSLHIVSALLNQSGTQILVPGGSVFREQSIILSPIGEDNMPRFYGPKLFMGAASVGSGGIMQADPVLVASERLLIERAEEMILLVDSSKFKNSSGHVVCNLEKIDVVITDVGIPERTAEMIKAAGARLITV